MASMNNWLGFSLSSQPPHHHQDHSQNSVSELGFNSDECFDLTSDSTMPSLNTLPPPPFPIFEAFNKNPQSQDWDNMKDVSINSFSCNALQNQETPKLENFLGVEEHNNFPENSNMGLSMIKNWLRNHPVPAHAADNKVDNEAAPPQGQVAGAQTLSLSMSTGSQSSDNKLQTAIESQNNGGAIESLPRKSVDTFGQRTSIYRGVTRHRWTGRYEAHLWDNSCRREGQTRKGRQVYLGGYDKEEKAARAYDLAALKYWGTTTTTNFPISNYEKELEEMKHMTRQEYVASLRRKSSGFSRGASIYRGVTRHHQHGRWQARIGRVAGNKDLYLGTFSTQEEAAEAYDIAAIKFRGLNAVTNFEINRYDVKSILESSTLPIGGGAKRLKDAENAGMALQMQRADEGSLNLQLTDEQTNGYSNGSSIHGWPTIAFQAHPLSLYPSYAHQRMWYKQEQDSDIRDGLNDIHDQQLQLGNNQSFLQNSVMHNHMISLDSSSVDQGSGFVYGNGTNGSSFMVPMMGRDGDQKQMNGDFVGNDEEKAYGYEGMFGSSSSSAAADAYRNLYYQSQQSSSSSNGIAKASFYNDQVISTCNNWNIPSGVPTLAARVCHGASTFAAWNDT